MRFKTLTEIASHYSVSRRAVEAWRERSDWPERQADGTIDGAAVEEFLRRNSLGPHNRRRRSGDTSDTLRDALHEATTRKLFEQSENERIRKERQLVDQAIEQGVLMRTSDVLRMQSRAIATVMALQSAFEQDMDRAIPDDVPGKAEVMRLVRRLPQTTFEAIEAMQ